MLSKTTNNYETLVDWTEEELDEVLYQWDNNTNPIIEFKYPHQKSKVQKEEVIQQKLEVSVVSLDDKKEQEKLKNDNVTKAVAEELDSFEPAYINITIDGDDIHLFEFYAPWCPHCQHFKPMYVQIAREIIKRSINVNVFFHAVSCTLNDIVCETYGIDGYPTLLGYRGDGGERIIINDKFPSVNNEDSTISQLVSNTTLRGTLIELKHNLNHDIDTIASVMQFDLASLPRNYTSPESKYSNSEDQREYEKEKIERSKEAAAEKLRLLEYQATKNQIYHDAILSLTYILQNGIYYRSNSKLKEYGEITSLKNFLALLHWSTPLQWSMRKTLVQELLHDFQVIIQGKGALNNVVEKHLSVGVENKNQGLPWGFIYSDDSRPYQLSRRRSANNSVMTHKRHTGSELKPKNDEDNLKEYDEIRKWTSACDHGPTSRGFTCGLWELLHIITIGSGVIENQLYGFERGYMISQHDVTVAIADFIGHFFRCDVCRTNFVTMYDHCGHDHCTRLSIDSPFVARSKEFRSIVSKKSRRGDDQTEVALWLWEVHNSVNVRLLKEKAQRERRNFTKAEEVAAKFPPRKNCPSCWLDNDMSEWDSNEVYKYLKAYYWPGGDDVTHFSTTFQNGRHIHGEMSIEGEPLSTFGFYCTIAPLVLMITYFLRQYLSGIIGHSISSFRFSKSKHY